ncbi:MAG: class I SAM-dependent methyltransferase [Thermomicrobiales bacterium]
MSNEGTRSEGGGMGKNGVMIPNQHAIWDQGWKGQRQPASGFARRSIVQAEETLGRGPLAVVEFGCGMGTEACLFARRGHVVTALDFSTSAIAATRQAAQEAGLTNLTPRQLDYSRLPLPFPDESFDLAYSHLGLHYFPDPLTTALFAEIRRILRPGGFFAIRCKSVADPLYGQGDCLAERIYCRNGHVRHFYTKEYMAEKLAAFDILTLRRATSLRHASAYVEALARRKVGE